MVAHYSDVPDEDRMVVDGIPCTTALRTVIDIAPGVGSGDLERIVQDCLTRGHFTVEEARARLAADDMFARPGAIRLGTLLAWFEKDL